MAYTDRDYPTKKALKEAVAAGKKVSVYQPFMGEVPLNGETSVEGPHYPKPHTWYARVTMADGYIVKVK
jgi:hypothetical protein